MAERDYFPGRDYPDREKWLDKRATDRRALKKRGTVLYSSRPGGKPLRLGINLAKRIEERILARPGDRFKKSGGGVIGARHRYYTEN